MEAIKIIEHTARGFIEGAGIDALTWVAAGYIPELANPSGIPIPGYDPAGIHYDDLIALGISGAVAIFGAVKKNVNIVAEGLAMIAGHYILSIHQDVPPRPILTQVRTPTFEDLVKVD